MLAPWVKEALHAVSVGPGPQLMPAGVLVTVPFPSRWIVNVTVAAGFAAAAGPVSGRTAALPTCEAPKPAIAIARAPATLTCPTRRSTSIRPPVALSGPKRTAGSARGQG